MDASNSVCTYLIEDDGKILVIRPIKPIEVGRMEKNTDKLRVLYQEGYDIAQQLIRSERM